MLVSKSLEEAEMNGECEAKDLLSRKAEEQL